LRLKYAAVISSKSLLVQPLHGRSQRVQQLSIPVIAFLRGRSADASVRVATAFLEHDPEKPASDLIRDENRFSEKRQSETIAL
jgi:hypothetical protein